MPVWATGLSMDGETLWYAGRKNQEMIFGGDVE